MLLQTAPKTTNTQLKLGISDSRLPITEHPQRGEMKPRRLYAGDRAADSKARGMALLISELSQAYCRRDRR